MKKILIYFAIYFLIVALPFAAFITAGECAPDNYANAFTAALVDKYHRLQDINEQKIVFVGGSSLPFGLRCDLIEEELNVKAVDFGVYASLGTKVMMEVSLANLNAGDIVVLAPELAVQTYSLYFNADVFWQAAAEDRSMFRYLDQNEKQLVLYNYLDYLYGKLSISQGEGVSSNELYSRTSFNEYGDISYSRKGNVMPAGVDRSQPISLDFEKAEFLAYVNEYVKKVRDLGADVYFSFSPTNALAVSFTQKEGVAFEQDIEETLTCPILGHIQDFTYDAEYFYNTNYHLNDRGAVLHTVKLINLLKEKYGVNTPTNIEVPPAEEPIEPGEPVEEDPLAACFDFEFLGGKYYLCGVKEEYRSATELTLPVNVNGATIAGLSSNCFAGCHSLEKLTVPNNYRSFDIQVFAGCGNLREIYLYIENPGTTSIPVSGLFDGANENLTVYVLGSQYTAFQSNYTWSQYRNLFKKFEP